MDLIVGVVYDWRAPYNRYCIPSFRIGGLSSSVVRDHIDPNHHNPNHHNHNNNPMAQ